ncbi:hypothetical protein BKA57DRAFT_448288 [Linnemannia elongata]|nr:hypothetical protein BKA57DRAFT_448288 [Linnemannia elongata]
MPLYFCHSIFFLLVSLATLMTVCTHHRKTLFSLHTLSHKCNFATTILCIHSTYRSTTEIAGFFLLPRRLRPPPSKE